MALQVYGDFRRQRVVRFVDVLGSLSSSPRRQDQSSEVSNKTFLLFILLVLLRLKFSSADRVMRAIQLLILPGSGIIDGFEVRKDGRTWNCFS